MRFGVWDQESEKLETTLIPSEHAVSLCEISISYIKNIFSFDLHYCFILLFSTLCDPWLFRDMYAFPPPEPQYFFFALQLNFIIAYALRTIEPSSCLTFCPVNPLLMTTEWVSPCHVASPQRGIFPLIMSSHATEGYPLTITSLSWRRSCTWPHFSVASTFHNDQILHSILGFNFLELLLTAWHAYHRLEGH